MLGLRAIRGITRANAVSSPLLALDDAHGSLLHPAANAIVKQHTTQHRASEFFVHTAAAPSALALSADRRRLAIAEVHEPRPQLVLVEINSGHRSKPLTCADTDSKRYLCAAFSANGARVAAIGDGAAADLIVWDASELQLLYVLPRSERRMALSRISWSPVEEHVACGTGPLGALVVWRLTDAKVTAKEWAVSKGQSHDLADHCWLDDGLVAACTSAGGVLLYRIRTGELIQTLGTEPVAEPCVLSCICKCASGFAVAGADGLLIIFERSAEGAFAAQAAYRCPPTRSGAADGVGGMLDQLLQRDPLHRRSDESGSLGAGTASICAVAASPAQDRLYVATESSQLAVLDLPARGVSAQELPDVSPANAAAVDNVDGVRPVPSLLPLTGLGTHHGAINALDACATKPLLVSCGADCTIRVWDSSTLECLLLKETAVEPLSASMHPMGIFIAAGFGDKLRLFDILFNDIRLAAELDAKGVTVCRFSHSGHLLAAISGTAIHVFAVHSLKLLSTLSGHLGLPRSIHWAEGDHELVSAGDDGAVFTWNVRTRERVHEHVARGRQYCAIALDGSSEQGGLAIAAAGSSSSQAAADCFIRHIAEGAIVSEAIGEHRVTQLAISPADGYLVAGMASGAVRLYNWPLTPSSVPVADLSVHAAPVRHLALSSKSRRLYCASDDGAISVLDMPVPEGHHHASSSMGGDRMSKLLSTATKGLVDEERDVVAVARSELQAAIEAASILHEQACDVKLRAEYNARQCERGYEDQLRAVHASHEQSQSIAAAKLVDERRAHEESIRRAADEAALVEAAHTQAFEELEYLYDRRLASETAKVDAIRAEKAELESSFDRQLLAVRAAFERREHEAFERAGAVEHKATLRAHTLEAETAIVRREMEALAKQELEDSEALTTKMEATHLAAVEADRHAHDKLRQEVVAYRSRGETIGAKLESCREALAKKEQEVLSLRAATTKVEERMVSMRRDIRDRERTISEKEERISALKSQAKELEKYKHVLDYKYREQTRKLEPRNEQILEMRDMVRDLDEELKRDHNSRRALEQTLADAEGKVGRLQADSHKLRRQLHTKERAMAELMRELHHLAGLSDHDALRAGVKKLYKLHAADDAHGDHAAASAARDAAGLEFGRQRQQLERSLVSMRGQAERAEEMRREHYHSLMQANQALVDECNSLRQQLTRSDS